MRQAIMGEEVKVPDNMSNGLNGVSQENHLSFANRQYPGMAARLRELRQSGSDIDFNNAGSKNFLLGKNNLSQMMALSERSGGGSSAGSDSSEEKRNQMVMLVGQNNRQSCSDFGQIIEEEKEEHKQNEDDEFNNRSHVHKRFGEKMDVIKQDQEEDQDLSPIEGDNGLSDEDQKKMSNKNYLLNYL